MISIKILGTGCAACQSMYHEVNKVLARNGWQAEVEYVQDLQRIMSYGVLTTPVLVVDEKIAMVGFRGASKIEQVLRSAISSLSGG